MDDPDEAEILEMISAQTKYMLTGKKPKAQNLGEMQTRESVQAKEKAREQAKRVAENKKKEQRRRDPFASKRDMFRNAAHH